MAMRNWAPYPKNVGWPAAMITRAAEALHEHEGSSDTVVLAQVALRAAIANNNDLKELLDANPLSAIPSSSPPR
jgi:hypothetical protein